MKQPRSFALQVMRDPSGYSVELTVTSNGDTTVLTRLEGDLMERLRPALVNAVVASKHPRTVLSPTRRAPIGLSEDAGVRLALMVLAAKPITKPRRVEEIRTGIDTMTSEEALYWYAQCTGPNSNRALRALRILLAEE